MSENFENTTVLNQYQILTQKTYTIDFDKIKTIEDVVTVLKSMQLHVSFDTNNIPEAFKEIYDKGFLIEKK